MNLSLAEIIAAKKAQSKEEPLGSFLSESDDLFLLSSPSRETDAALRALLHLVNKGSSKANLTANDCAGLRRLVSWLAPFRCSHLPNHDKVPRFLQSFTMWQLSAITGIPPSKLWPILLEVIIESEKISLDKKSGNC
jgi:hypothetical protein